MLPTRVPATLREAQAALAHADPQAMASLQEGYRYHESTSTYGGVEQRWVLIYSEPRQAQAQRTVDKQLRKQGDKEVKAFQHLCTTTFACETDARQALGTFEQDVQATLLHTSTVRALSRYGTRGRPRQGAQPAEVPYQIDRAFAWSLPTRPARLDQATCFILDT